MRTIQKLQALLALSLNLDLSRAACCTPRLSKDQVPLRSCPPISWGWVSDLESEWDGVCRCPHSQFQVCNPDGPNVDDGTGPDI